MTQPAPIEGKAPIGGKGPRVSRWRKARGLYAIADADAALRQGLDLFAVARAMAEAPICAVQIRAKGRAAGWLCDELSKLSRDWPQDGPHLIVNDRADVAELARVAGVHLGQDDLPAARLLEGGSPLLVGLSTHDNAQLERALDGPRLDYVALGPIFGTRSKHNPEPEVGLEALETAGRLARARGVPLVAIGGITERTLNSVARRSDMIAAIGVLLDGLDSSAPYRALTARCAKLQKAIQEEPI